MSKKCGMKFVEMKKVKKEKQTSQGRNYAEQKIN